MARSWQWKSAKIALLKLQYRSLKISISHSHVKTARAQLEHCQMNFQTTKCVVAVLLLIVAIEDAWG